MRIFKKEKNRNSDPFVIQEGPLRDFRLNEDRNFGWVEESIESSAAPDEGGHERVAAPKDFIGLAMNQKRLAIFLIFIFGVLGVLFARTVYLQIIRGAYYREMAEGNRIRTVYTSAERGIIYDRNGTPLVKNVPMFSLYVVPTDLPKDENQKNDTLNYLAGIANVSREEIDNDLKNVSQSSYAPVLIKENVDYADAIRLKVESASLQGVDLRTESRREYFKGSDDSVLSLSHVLGYVGKVSQDELIGNEDYNTTDFIGKTGLEAYYESTLRGKNGQEQIEVDALGKEKSVLAKEDPVRGQNITLTLDVNVQQKLEEIINKELKAAKKSRAAAIVMNPQNGDILALVSLPAFDNNLFAEGISSKDYAALENDPNKPLFNRAVMGEYPSGSTIKPVYAAGALEEGIITKSTTFLSTGGLRVGSWFFPDWLAGGHGLTNVTKAIADSVNTFFYIIGGGYDNFKGLGVDGLMKYARIFGFGAKLGIDLPNEATGFLPSEKWKEETKGEQWYIGDTYHLAIGQGDLLVTPLQIAAETSAFANGGALYVPHLLDSIDSATQPKDKYLLKTDLISKNSLDIVRSGMRQTVMSGSAKLLQNLPVTSAAKTGTAQWSTTGDPHAWFTSFAPYDNPEIEITVLVEEGVEGSQITEKIADEFLQWYFTR